MLYLLPLVTITDALVPFLAAAAICAPLFTVWVAIDYRRVMLRGRQPGAAPQTLRETR